LVFGLFEQTPELFQILNKIKWTENLVPGDIIYIMKMNKKPIKSKKYTGQLTEAGLYDFIRKGMVVFDTESKKRNKKMDHLFTEEL
jgi:hypothetical protein